MKTREKTPRSGLLEKISHPIDLTQGTPWKVILRYSAPIILSYLLQQIYVLTDAIICGQVLTAEEVASDTIKSLQSRIQALEDENRFLKDRLDEAGVSYADIVSGDAEGAVEVYDPDQSARIKKFDVTDKIASDAKAEMKRVVAI